MKFSEFNPRQEFKDSWVFETPAQQTGINSKTALGVIYSNVLAYKTAIKDEIPGFSESIESDLNKIRSQTKVIYYKLKNNKMTFGIELDKHGSNYYVSLVAKDESNPEYVSNLYIRILQDLNSRILSDNKLTLGGFSIWIRLLSSSLVTVAVYDPKNTSGSVENNSYKQINSELELKQYFGLDINNPDYAKTRFVLGLKVPMSEAWEKFTNRLNRSKAICEDGRRLTEHDDEGLQ